MCYLSRATKARLTPLAGLQKASYWVNCSPGMSIGRPHFPASKYRWRHRRRMPRSPRGRRLWGLIGPVPCAHGTSRRRLKRCVRAEHLLCLKTCCEALALLTLGTYLGFTRLGLWISGHTYEVEAPAGEGRPRDRDDTSSPPYLPSQS